MRPLKTLNRISCDIREAPGGTADAKPAARGRPAMCCGCLIMPSGVGPGHLALALLERAGRIRPLHDLGHLEEVVRSRRALGLRVAHVEVRDELVLVRAEERRVGHA